MDLWLRILIMFLWLFIGGLSAYEYYRRYLKDHKSMLFILEAHISIGSLFGMIAALLYFGYKFSNTFLWNSIKNRVKNSRCKSYTVTLSPLEFDLIKAHRRMNST